MSIYIRGYDIASYNKNSEETDVVITGVAHLERNNQIADVPFEGRHEKGMTGFAQFQFLDPDQIQEPEIRKRADELRDLLAEHLLETGYEPGEYPDTLTL